MLWEPSVAGQSYWAVLWISAGCSGDRGRGALEVGRQSVHVWVRRYRREVGRGWSRSWLGWPDRQVEQQIPLEIEDP